MLKRAPRHTAAVDQKIDAAVRRAFNNRSGTTGETKMRSKSTEGATSAHYDVGNSKPTGTRTSKTQRRGKLGTDDFNETLSEHRHGEQLLGGRHYGDHPEVVAEAQRHSDDIIDKHARDPRIVEYKRADALPNQLGYESQYKGVPLDGEPKSVNPDTRQAKRGARKA